MIVFFLGKREKNKTENETKKPKRMFPNFFTAARITNSATLGTHWFLLKIFETIFKSKFEKTLSYL